MNFKEFRKAIENWPWNDDEKRNDSPNGNLKIYKQSHSFWFKQPSIEKNAISGDGGPFLPIPINHDTKIEMNEELGVVILNDYIAIKYK